MENKYRGQDFAFIYLNLSLAFFVLAALKPKQYFNVPGV